VEIKPGGSPRSEHGMTSRLPFLSKEAFPYLPLRRLVRWMDGYPRQAFLVDLLGTRLFSCLGWNGMSCNFWLDLCVVLC